VSHSSAQARRTGYRRNRVKYWIVAILALVVCLPAATVSAKTLSVHEARRNQLDRMRQDEKLRAEQAKTGNVDAAKLAASEAANTELLRRVVDELGWPTSSIVGPSASSAAYYLVEHVAIDLQRDALRLMEAAVSEGKESPDRLAYLTDVVRLREGKPQLYGTQLHVVDGILRPEPIEDEANVDSRRAKVGLRPLAEFLDQAARPGRS
jgi:hypothetical protein